VRRNQPDGNGQGAPDEKAPAAAHRRASDAGAGALVLIGGACTPEGDAFGRFIELTGARQGGRVIGFTTASADPMASAVAWKNDFAAAGAKNVEIPIVDRRDRAQDPQVAKMVKEADGIFLGGGDQVHLVSTLAGSRVARAIVDAFRRGATVCGTSAGAAALTETILAGGEPDETGVLVDMYTGPGFGLLGFHAVIDTHFGARRRLHRLFNLIAMNPELMGLGIDEDTALVVRGHIGEVVGKGGVIFVDGRDVRFDNADEAKHTGASLTLSHLRVGIVGAGYSLNLRDRELEVLVQAEEELGGTPSVKGEESR
jgi:cyanophycinase